MPIHCKVILFLVLLLHTIWLVLQAINARGGMLVFWIGYALATIALIICFFIY